MSVHRVRTRREGREGKGFVGMGLMGLAGIWPSRVCVRAMMLYPTVCQTLASVR